MSLLFGLLSLLLGGVVGRSLPLFPREETHEGAECLVLPKTFLLVGRAVAGRVEALSIHLVALHRYATSFFIDTGPCGFFCES